MDRCNFPDYPQGWLLHRIVLYELALYEELSR
jgi:hypothetical protein